MELMWQLWAQHHFFLFNVAIRYDRQSEKLTEVTASDKLESFRASKEVLLLHCSSSAFRAYLAYSWLILHHFKVNEPDYLAFSVRSVF